MSAAEGFRELADRHRNNERSQTMQVFWWQAGLHFEPESNQDRDALLALELAFRKLGMTGRKESPVTAESRTASGDARK